LDTDVLRESLAGRRVLVTGVTGFVGEALFARLLADFPDTHVLAVVRPRGGQSGRDRIERLMAKPAFKKIQLNGLNLESRVTILEGDLDQPPPLPSDLDVAVHCAGDVTFDPPIDTAFATNVWGVQRLLEALSGAGPACHYVHVSTAYVSGRARGEVAERRLEHGVDWRVEAAAAERLRLAVEDASRAPRRLAALHAAAAREHGPTGPLATAADTERRRIEWVADELRRAGGERARSLGWTDVYTFSKAMGERVVEELAGDRPVSIVRPSIIESALERPEPGWIEGFKMADPLILAFGRGELPDIPIAPDAIADLVPVDFVVSALLAAAARRPPPGAPAYFHVASGARKPLTYRRFYDHVTTYFEAHPLPGSDGIAPVLPRWRWPGADRVQRRLRQAERLQHAADRVVTLLPGTPRVRAAVRGLDRQGRRLEFLRRYGDLYRPYTEAQAVFVDDETLGLFEALPVEDRADFPFDTGSLDWGHYLTEVHCPAVSEPLRVRPRRPRPAAAGTGRAVGLPQAGDTEPGALAVFDLDGTLLSADVVTSYLWLRTTELRASRPAAAAELARLAGQLPGYLALERRDRGAFLRAVYRRYAGASLAGLEALVDETVGAQILAHCSAAGLRRVRQHRAAGHRTLLITGAIRPLTRPLAPLFDEIVAVDLAVDDRGRATGFLAGPPVVGEGRAAWLAHYARSGGYDLDRSYAYGDDHSDLPMLQAVGQPVAVNPDVPLLRVARRHRWRIEDWQARDGAQVAVR
jgi:fatty acyl-CoA reductase